LVKTWQSGIAVFQLNQFDQFDNVGRGAARGLGARAYKVSR
jgi:hypothetical protein